MLGINGMKAKLLRLIVCITLFGVPPAAATTFSVSSAYAPDLTGTITTNGHTGALSTSDILSFDLTINAFGTVATLTPSNSQVLVQGVDLFATTTTLSFNYGDTSPGVPFCCDANAGRLAFFNSPNPSDFSVQFISAGYIAASVGYLTLGSNFLGSVLYLESSSSDQIIASSPLPAAFPLFVTGIVGLGWLAKRRPVARRAD